MNREIDRIQKTRQYLINQVNDLTPGQLNKIPEGFNNNIAWQLGHLIASQQGICYFRRGAAPVVDEKYFIQYKPGTRPENDIDEQEVTQIKEVMMSSIDRLQTDYQNKVFDVYPAWTTRYGVEIASIEDAFQFLLYHEGLHAGTILAMKRLVSI